MSDLIQIPSDFPIRTVLVVDDDPGLRLVVTKSLERAGFECRQAEDAVSAMELLKTWDVHLVISDISMPGEMDGIDLLKRIKEINPDTSVIIMTGYGGQYSYVDIMDAGASDYMTKPFNMNSALARINRIAREKKHLINLNKTNQELCRAIDRSNVLAREAREASKAKTFFLASMSHEIRTPLNGIVGYTDMLMDTPLNDEQKSFLKNARLSCETLLNVVNDILDFSKVEAGKLKLEHIEFDPEVLCFDVINVVRPKVDESQVDLLCAVSANVPGRVIGDPHRFRQVLLNLLGNAVKFTEKGSITLSLDAADQDEGMSELIIKINDTGIGILDTQIDKIFHPFIQSEDDITNRYGGTGLGLAISKNIALKMAGDIVVKSRINKGSEFTFTSRVKIAGEKSVQRIKSARLKGKTVLLATVSEETFSLFSRDFELAGMKVIHVPYSHWPDLVSDVTSKSIDIAVIDFGKLSKLDSADFADHIKRIQPERFSFDFIACAVPVPGIAIQFQQTGYKGFLPKPVRREKLFEMVSYLLGYAKRPDKVTASPILTAHLMSENKKHAVSILLVEDNPVNQKMTTLMLTKAGYCVDIASNGEEAVTAYTTAPDHYDLIFMDINMPVMDGFTATRKIRSFEADQGIDPPIPVLALTANVLDNFKEECRKSGMNDFLTKPIKRDIVFEAILQWTAPLHIS